MEMREVFRYIKNNLRIQLSNASEPVTCGGEVDGILGVRVKLLLIDPETQEEVVISEDDCYIG